MEVTRNFGFSVNGYKVKEAAGSGGSARIYKALQDSTGQMVALKFLHSDSSGAKARFEREVSLYSQLQHPHIVRMLDHGVDGDGTPFTVFEYVPGETLATYLLKNGAIPINQAIDLMSQVLDALVCAHRLGIVHRDLNPANIMLTRTGTKLSAKLLDFGIGAKLPEAQGPEYRHITLDSDALGTPAYSSPEQLRGDKPAEQSDIYAWALIFAECILGSPLVQAGSVAEVIQKQLSSIDTPLPAFLAGHPLGALLRQALKKSLQHRTSDANRLWHELQTIGTNSSALQPVPFSSQVNDEHEGEEDCVTQVIPEAYEARHDLTALCVSVSLQALGEETPSAETLVAAQEDVLNRCADIAATRGGAAMDSFSNCMLITFGYPDTSSGEIRRAIEAAKAIVTELTQSEDLHDRELIAQVRIGLDRGATVVGHDNIPRGTPINTAFRLCQQAYTGGILLGEQLLASMGTKKTAVELGELTLIDEALNIRASYLKVDTRIQSQAISSVLDFCGRETEYEKLRSLWCSKSDSGIPYVQLIGEAGVGKSRLLQEFETSIRDEGALILRCNCYPEQRNQALYPVLSLLSQQLRLKSPSANESSDSSDEAMRRLRRFCASLSDEPDVLLIIMCRWLDLPEPTDLPPLQYSPQKQKSLLIDALIKWLVQYQPRHRILLAIEDIHWSDPTTLALLIQLSETAHESHLMLVATSRQSTACATMSDQVKTIQLQPLTAADVKSIIAQHLPGDSKNLVDQIASRSDGMPLFIEELIRLLKTSSALPPASSIPLSLQESLNERISNLGEARHVAQFAACIGRQFSSSLLAVALRMEPDELSAQLNTLTESELIQPTGETERESYRFRHVLIRDTAYHSMTRAMKLEAHTCIADTLASDVTGSLDHQLLAYHYAGAENYINAIHHGTEAAQHALSQALNEDAEALALSAMKLTSELIGTERTRAELMLNEVLTHIKLLSAGWADTHVKAHAERSLQLIESLGSRREVHSSIWSLALYHHVASDRQMTARLADQLLDLTRGEQDKTLHCNALGLRGQCAFIDGQFQQAYQYFQDALTLYDEESQQAQLTLSSVDTRVWSLSQMANLQWLSGWHHQAVATSAEALSWAKRLGHIPSLGIALLYRAMLCQFAADKTATVQISEALLTLSIQYGLPAYQGYATVLNAWACGDQKQLQGMLTGLRAMGCQLGLSQYDSLTADIYFQNGQPEQAVHCLKQCLDFAAHSGEEYYTGELHRRLAFYLEEMGDEYADTAQYHANLASGIVARRNPQDGLTPPSYSTAPCLELPDRVLKIVGTD